MLVWYSLPIIEPLQVVLLCSTLDCGNMRADYITEQYHRFTCALHSVQSLGVMIGYRKEGKQLFLYNANIIYATISRECN